MAQHGTQLMGSWGGSDQLSRSLVFCVMANFVWNGRCLLGPAHLFRVCRYISCF